MNKQITRTDRVSLRYWLLNEHYARLMNVARKRGLTPCATVRMIVLEYLEKVSV